MNCAQLCWWMTINAYCLLKHYCDFPLHSLLERQNSSSWAWSLIKQDIDTNTVHALFSDAAVTSYEIQLHLYCVSSWKYLHFSNKIVRSKIVLARYTVPTSTSFFSLVLFFFFLETTVYSEKHATITMHDIFVFSLHVVFLQHMFDMKSYELRVLLIHESVEAEMGFHHCTTCIPRWRCLLSCRLPIFLHPVIPTFTFPTSHTTEARVSNCYVSISISCTLSPFSGV